MNIIQLGESINMKVLVTGVAGFIGSHAAELFVKNGYEVIGVDNFNNYYPVVLKEKNAADLEKIGVKIVKKDLRTDNLDDVTADVDFIVHLAAQPGISSKVTYKEYKENNLDATENLVSSSLKNLNLKLFINAATSSVYGYYADSTEDIAPKPASYYGVTKLAAEQLVMFRQRFVNFPATSFRLFSVTGPRDRPNDKLFTKLIKNSLEEGLEPITIFKGSRDHKRSYTYVGDIVNAFLMASKKPDVCVGQIFNIGTSEIITTGQAMEFVEEALGKKLNVVDVEETRAGDQQVTSAVIDKVQKVLGWSPQVSTKQALQEAVEWYKNEIHNKINY